MYKTDAGSYKAMPLIQIYAQSMSKKSSIRQGSEEEQCSLPLLMPSAAESTATQFVYK